MRNRVKILIILFILILTDVLLGFSEEEAQNQIRAAQQMLIQIDNTLRLRPYIPFDIYGDALAELLEARNHLSDKNFGRAYYKASMAKIKFETLPILAEAREIREKILIQERENLKKKGGSTLYKLIIDASLDRKGDAYHRNMPDSLLFRNPALDLTDRGKKALDSIIEVVKSAESASLILAGHSSDKQGAAYSRNKAEAVSKYMKDAGIPPEKITVYGLGDAEVMDTPLGSMRIDRVEVIIGGLNGE